MNGAGAGVAGTTGAVSIGKRNVEGGGRINDVRHTDFRYVVGAKGQIDGAVRKAKGAAGIPASPGYGAAGNGYPQGYNQNASQPGYGSPSAGQPYPGGRRGSSGA